jgi:excisionase family DNA binding protein
MPRESKWIEPDTLSVPEAGKRLGISRNLAYEAAARGEIPIIRIGHRVLVPRVALERLLAGFQTVGNSGLPTGPQRE